MSPSGWSFAALRKRSARTSRGAISDRSGSAASRIAIRTSFPAACASGWGWRGRSSVNADVLLMDEPFSAVDEQTRRKFQEDLLDLVARERKTFIFVTHSIEEAVYVSDRIVLLSPRPGRISRIIEPDISREGDPDAIRRHPVYLDTVDAIWQDIKKYLD